MDLRRKLTNILLLIIALAPTIVVCADDPDADVPTVNTIVANVRVLARESLSELAMLVRLHPKKNLFTGDLKKRLTASETVALVVSADEARSVWYADKATTSLQRIDVETREHTLLWEYAHKGSDALRTLVGRTEVITKMVPVYKTSPKVKVEYREVTETVVRWPSQEKIESALEYLESIENSEIRQALKTAAGARLAQLPPELTSTMDSADVQELVAAHRVAVAAVVRESIDSLTETDLPRQNEPFLAYGDRGMSAGEIVSSVQGRIPAVEFESAHGTFAGVWNRGNLVVMRMPPSAESKSTYPLSVSEELLKKYRLGPLPLRDGTFFGSEEEVEYVGSRQ